MSNSLKVKIHLKGRYVNMLHTIAEVAVLSGLSKVSIYNKIKLREMQDHVTKKQGVTYIDDIFLAMIKDSLNLNDGLKPIKNQESDSTIKAHEIWVLKAKDDYINHLKSENEKLWIQVQEKDLQLSNLHRIIENSQVLLKNQQLALEEKKSFFKGLFRKK